MPVLGQPAAAGLEPLGAIAPHRLGVLGALALELLLGLAKPGSAAVRGAKPLGQLVAAGIAVDLVLGGVDPSGLGEDLGGDLLVGADRSVGGVGGELGAVDREHADLDDPRLAAEPSTWPKSSASTSSWRTRKRAIVAWSGTWLAQITRKATSSRQRRSICRAERSPTA